MALALTIESKIEAAYRRGDLFEKRRKLMDAWAGYCTAGTDKREGRQPRRLVAEGGRTGHHMKAWQTTAISVVLTACLERAMGRPIDNEVWVTWVALVDGFKRQAVSACNEEARQNERDIAFTPAAAAYLQESRRDPAVRKRRV